MNYLRKQLFSGISIADDEWEEVQTLFKKTIYEKGQIIHNAGKVMDKIYYLKEGVVKSSFISDEGKEFVWQIYFKAEKVHKHNVLLDDCVSYYEQIPSRLSFEVLEKCICYETTWNALENLYDRDTKWQKLGRLLTQQGYASAYKRSLSLLGMSALDRYKALVMEFPCIFDRVKSYHVAAYLGITPQSLSRLKKIIIDE